MGSTDTAIAPGLLREARTRARLSQRALGARAGVQQPVIAAYEAGRRQPSLPMLRRLLRAAGYDLDIALRPIRPLPDPDRAGRVLLLVLDLAEHLPRRRRPARLSYPRLPVP